MVENKKEPEIVYGKHADKSRHKIIIPSKFIEKWGYEFLMEVYDDKLVIVPIKKEKEVT